MSTGSLTAVRVIVGLLGAIGTVTNAVNISLLSSVKIGALSAVALLRSQVAIDCFNCFIVLLSRIFDNIPLTGNHAFDTFVCYVWMYDELFWFGVVLSIQNMVCISFERLTATILPIFYRMHQRLIVVLSLTYVLVISVVFVIPNIALKRFTNATCHTKYEKDSLMANWVVQTGEYVWLILNYIFPGTVIIVCHSWIMVRIYRQNQTNEGPCSEHQPPYLSAERSFEREKTKIVRKLARTTVIMAVLFLTLFAFEAVLHLLAGLNVPQFDNLRVISMYGQALLVLYLILNPCVLVMTNRTIRTRAKQLLHSFIEKVHGRVFENNTDTNPMRPSQSVRGSHSTLGTF